MPKRSSKQKDTQQLARSVLDALAPDAEPKKPAKKKNAAAVALGKLGGLKGGKARAAKLSPAQRKAKVKVRDNLTGDPVPPKNAFTSANSVDVPFRKNAPGVINVTELRKRLAAKSPNSGGTLEPNEYALQMLRFPYRQVFGDPDNVEGQRFYDVDKFVVTIALTDWKTTITDKLNTVNP